jgi:UDP-glucuronate decarboxylase
MESDAAAGGPVNLGNPAELSVAELAARVLALTGSRSRIVRRPLPEDDPRRRRPDISRAGSLLGWRPKVALEEGLEATIAWFARQRDEVHAWRPAAAAASEAEQCLIAAAE